MNYRIINPIRILPSDKKTFPNENSFKYFFETTMVNRGGYYYFPQKMMVCPNNTLVLFQYDGKIRATGLLVDSAKKQIIDENGEKYGGYYRFDVQSLHYLLDPITADEMRMACRDFISFNQSKKKISLDYVDSILSLLAKKDNFYCCDLSLLIDDIDKEIKTSGLKGRDIEAYAKIRINQSVFRRLLFDRYQCCCLCGISDQSLLVASHIKPWSASNGEEKADVDNGLLLCPNHDKLFDVGYISFNDDGTIIISKSLSLNDMKRININKDIKVNLTEKNKAFLEYHRKHVLKK